ncbi:hypothetical protein CDIK_0362 [Cucumispora dikerogammari]|nr:hypothetical protein CDIK_0362 [Cucumispora dikerogammari]
MSSSSFGIILFYTIIAIGLRLNTQVRDSINKYYMQDVLKIPKLVTNRAKHVNDAISSFAKIALSLLSGFMLGPYKTILIFFPIHIITFGINIFSSIVLSGNLKYYLYLYTFYVGSMIGVALFTIFIPFVKVQLTNKATYVRFLDTWYIVFNTFCSFVYLILPILFKNYISIKCTNIKLLMFIVSPILLSALFFIIFILNKSTYIIETPERISFFRYFLMFFKENKNHSKDRNKNKLSGIKCVFTLLFADIFWAILTDQFFTMVIDFTDAARLPTYEIFGKKWVTCGSALESINSITVVLVTPIMFFYIYPRVLHRWSKYRKLVFGFLINQMSLMLALFFHMLNSQRDCIDSSLSPHFAWYIIPWVMNATSELIWFPIILKTITTVAPPEYIGLCTTLIWSTNGFASLYCYAINLIDTCETIRCLLFFTSSIVVYFIVYLAYLHEEGIVVLEDEKHDEAVES